MWKFIILALLLVVPLSSCGDFENGSAQQGTIDSAWGEAKFEIETFQYAGDDCNSSWILYPNEETYLEEKRRQEKLQAIREYFRNWAREVPSEIVNGVYELIRAEVEMDAN